MEGGGDVYYYYGSASASASGLAAAVRDGESGIVVDDAPVSRVGPKGP